MVGDERYVHKSDTSVGLIRETQIVAMAALLYGAARAYIQLTSSGFERESIQFQRHAIEYYMLSRYYSDNPKWSLLDLLVSTKDERDFLRNVISEHGSRERLRYLEDLVKHVEEILQGLPKTDRQHIRPSMETLIKKYSGAPSAYVMRYRWPSQTTHGTSLAHKYALMEDGTPRFESDIATSNAIAGDVSECVIMFMSIAMRHVTVRNVPDVKGFRKELSSARKRLKVKSLKLS